MQNRLRAFETEQVTSLNGRTGYDFLRQNRVRAFEAELENGRPFPGEDGTPFKVFVDFNLTSKALTVLYVPISLGGDTAQAARGQAQVTSRSSSSALSLVSSECGTYETFRSESHARNMALTVLHVPCSLDSGARNSPDPALFFLFFITR